MASKVQDCDCGFADSNDPTGSIFTSFLAVNFSAISDSKFYDYFLPATYEVRQRDSPYSRNFTSSLVGVSEAGLGLTVLPPAKGSTEVPCAQIFSKAATYFYGSYHARYRVDSIPGTVTAFFNYKSDSSEVDVEYLSSSEVPTLLYTVKPQIYTSTGSADNSTLQTQSWAHGSEKFNDGFHDWSFVWLPDIVHYALDGDFSKSITTNVPRAPGRLALGHWSDGNPNYSLGPPKQSSTVHLSFLWGVYNDTNANELTCSKTTSPCTVTDGVFQSTASGGGGGGGGSNGGSSVTIVNSAYHTTAPVAPGWYFALLIFFWFSCRRSP